MENWLAGLFGGPGFGAGGSMSAAAPQMSSTMMYPFTSVGGNLGPENAPWLNPQQPTTSPTNAEGQQMDAVGNPMAGGAGAMPGGANPTFGTLPGGAQPGGGGDKLLQALRGLKAPEAPVAQKVATPHPPPIARIQSGQLVNLLASLGIAPPTPGLRLGGR